MTNPYLEHPNEEALERFLLHKSDNEELEVLETHFLACELCLTRLETLELQITDLKAALAAAEQGRIAKENNAAPSRWKNWFTVPTLTWAGGACAALAVGLAIVPHHQQSRFTLSPVQDKSEIAEGALSPCRETDGALVPCRGMDQAALPQGRPLDLRLDTTDIPPGTVEVQLVNGAGSEIWHGATSVKNERAQVKLPQIAARGPYFLRFYTPNADQERKLLREFRFDVK